jgi:hypothetical protein
MSVVRAVKSGVKRGGELTSKINKDYLLKINLGLLIVVIIMLAFLLFSKSPTQCSDNVVNNVYEHIGDREIIITNTSTNQNGNLCYLTYVCTNTSNECPEPPCTDNSQICMNNSQCCSGCCKYTNNGQSICMDSSECSCKQETQTCSSLNPCCSGLTCTNGICQKPCSEISRSCLNTSNCCPGLTCLLGLCSPESCVPETQTCLHDFDCCSGLNCTNGLCKKPCVSMSGVCSNSSVCCAGLNCTFGQCY